MIFFISNFFISDFFLSDFSISVRFFFSHKEIKNWSQLHLYVELGLVIETVLKQLRCPKSFWKCPKSVQYGIQPTSNFICLALALAYFMQLNQEWIWIKCPSFSMKIKLFYKIKLKLEVEKRLLSWKSPISTILWDFHK